MKLVNLIREKKLQMIEKLSYRVIGRGTMKHFVYIVPELARLVKPEVIRLDCFSFDDSSVITI
jgi:hypothetical protein